MKHIVFIIFFLGMIVAFSQEYQYVPFPTENTIWSEKLQVGEGTFIYNRFALPGDDTVVNENKYKKLYLFHGQEFDKNTATYIGGIREDSLRRVYFYCEKWIDYMDWACINGEKDLLLYDFGVNVGDTIKREELDPTYPVTVYSIDTVLINGTLKKRYCLAWADYCCWAEVIEGIGNLKGLLFSQGTRPISVYNNLICCIQNNEIIYKNPSYKDCYPDLLSIEVPQQKKHYINVYPNPSNHGTIIFNLGDFPAKSIEIYTVEGILKDRVSLQGITGDFEYDLKLYKTGIYIYRIIGINGNVLEGKFIVQ